MAWQGPWSSWRLVLVIEVTQLIGTLAAVYGWFLTPMGWTYVLIWVCIASLVKIVIYKL
ncbi:MAG: hypothetical protein AB7V32_03565 [Candidatus Berkiella sp.]